MQKGSLLSPAAVGKRVAEARRSAGLPQSSLAATVGLDRTALSKIESGRRRVTSVELARIARALDRPIDSFVSEHPTGRGQPMRSLRRRRAAILRIARKHGARSVRVFGSTARGEARPGSDVDLLVEMDPGRGLLEQAALLVELQDLLQCDVDVVTPNALRARIRDRVLREAVPL